LSGGNFDEVEASVTGRSKRFIERYNTSFFTIG